MPIAAEITTSRPTAVAFANGRVFYALNNIVYFSQLVADRSLDPINKCYQKNDPTSEYLPDVLATDGGVIPINEASSIRRLLAFRDGVLAFSENGIWYIRGTAGGFTATAFSVSRITGAKSVSPDSVVAIEEQVFFWGQGGVFVIASNEFDVIQARNITDNTIKTFYTRLTPEQKASSFGVYNRENARIEWYYASPEGQDSSLKLGLYFELRTGGWFPIELATEDRIDTNGDYSLIAPLAVPKLLQRRGARYLFLKKLPAEGIESQVVYYIGERFPDSREEKFQDDVLPIQNSFFLSGFDTLRRPSNKKQAPYLVTHMVKTEEDWVDDGAGGLRATKPSSVLVSAQWDWNDSPTNGRWSQPQEMYRTKRTFVPNTPGPHDTGESIIEYKAKMLGRGSALSLYFEGKQDNKTDFQLLGYTLQWTIKSSL